MSGIKTENQVERDFFIYIKESNLGNAIRGNVYRPDMRPSDAKTEDLVVKFYTGVDAQVQTGTIILDLYVPDTKSKDGRMVRNHSRIGALQEEIQSFIDGFSEPEYLIETEVSPYTIEVEGLSQHCIKTRIKFQRLSQ